MGLASRQSDRTNGALGWERGAVGMLSRKLKESLCHLTLKMEQEPCSWSHHVMTSGNGEKNRKNPEPPAQRVRGRDVAEKFRLFQAETPGL